MWVHEVALLSGSVSSLVTLEFNPEFWVVQLRLL